MNINIKPKLIDSKLLNHVKKKNIQSSQLNKICNCLKDYFIYFIKNYYDFILVLLFLFTILYLMHKYNKPKKKE